MNQTLNSQNRTKIRPLFKAKSDQNRTKPWSLSDLFMEKWARWYKNVLMCGRLIVITSKINTNRYKTNSKRRVYALFSTPSSDFWCPIQTIFGPVCPEKSEFGPKSEKIRPFGSTGGGRCLTRPQIGWHKTWWKLIPMMAVIFWKNSVYGLNWSFDIFFGCKCLNLDGINYICIKKIKYFT